MKRILIFFVFISLSLIVRSQHKFILELGGGYPDITYGGLSYQFKKIEVFGKYGYFQNQRNITRQLTSGFRWHFMKNENMFVGNQHYWTGELCFTYLYRQNRIINGALFDVSKPMIRLNVGHLFELSDRFNLHMYTGINYELIDFNNDAGIFPITPGGGIAFQYEIIETQDW